MKAFCNADHGGVLTFLQTHEASSMFAIGNLLGRGIPTQVWLAQDASQITGYIGLTTSGNLLVQWPGGDWDKAAKTLRGQRLAGVLGPADQCQALIQALGIADVEMRKSQVEPGFSLDLAALKMPSLQDVRLAPITSSDADLVLAWRIAYLQEVMHSPLAMATAEATGDVEKMLASNSHRLLWRAKTPVAMAGFNIDLGVVAQIGGVYTPPTLRGQGFARQVLALMLLKAQGRGLERAVLFAASETAARAYVSLGFQPSHSYSMTFFAKPQNISCP